MECSNHTQREALVWCQACGKALCLECATEVDGAFACRGECETAVRAVLRAEHRSERKTLLVVGASMSILCLIGAFACFGIMAKDIWTTQRANMDEDGNFHVDPPITAKVTKTEKISYAAGGALLLVSGVYGLVVTLRTEK